MDATAVVGIWSVKVVGIAGGGDNRESFKFFFNVDANVDAADGSVIAGGIAGDGDKREIWLLNWFAGTNC